MKPDRLRLPILLVIVAGVLIRLVYVFSPPEKLITIVPDDAFYYFKIAKNIVSGIGSSFDGINPSNGYHPAWMIILLPLAWMIKQPWVFVKAVLFLTVFLNSLTTLFIYKFLKNKTKNHHIGCIGAAIYFLNPKVVANSLNGLETSLASLMLMVIIIFISKKARFKRNRSYYLLAILFGLCFLARTDLVFYFIPLFLYILYQAKSSQKNFKVVSKNTTIFIFSFLATILPWFAWSLIKLKTIFQSSANAVPYVLVNSFIQNNPFSSPFKNSVRLSYHFFSKDLLSIMGFSYPWGVIFVLLLVIFLSRKKIFVAGKNNKKELVFLLSLVVGGLGLSFTHVFFRWYPRPWYFDQLILAISLLVSYLIYLAIEATNNFKHKLVIIVFILITIATGIKNSLEINEYPHQVEMLSGSEWLKNNTSPDQIVVSFNSGIFGYFSDRIVVNLDGAVNQKAYLEIKKNQLWQISKQSKADYYIDYDPFMINLYQPFLGESFSRNNLTLVKVINQSEVSWEGNEIKIYAIK
jgi:hypothetical protein